ncbi:MAG: transporter substrate-binding domain-containing protein [Defluviitaleaceae bacterium]|nr:transporter substrate-binding domain-containing protein [Defluviitaleaceae bacterium]
MKKVLLVVLFLLALGLVAGCSREDETPAIIADEVIADETEDYTPEDTVEEEAEEAEEIAVTPEVERRTIIMGTSADFPPFEFIADGGQGRHGRYSGLDVAIAVRIAEALDADLVIHDAAFEGLIVDLQGGSIDFIAAAMTIRPDRMESVNFSIPYFAAVQYMVVMIDDYSIESAEDLNGLYVAVQGGTTGYFFVSDELDANVLPYIRASEAFAALLGGRVDAVVIDSAVAQRFVNANPDALRIVRDNEAFGDENYGIAVRFGEYDLLDTINEVIAAMHASGELAELYYYYTEGPGAPQD